MTIFVALVPLLTAIAPALLVGLVLWLVSHRGADDGGAVARAARRHELLVSLGALLAAMLAAFAMGFLPINQPWAPTPGILQALTPFGVAAVFALVRAVGELTWPRPRGEVRAAPLARRTPWSLGGARLKGVLITGGMLAVGLVVTGVTADGTGRGFTTPPVALPDGSTVSGTAGPYPGWPYGVPMLVGLAVVALVTWLALTAITRRRPLAGLPAAHDDAIRRTSADRLLAGIQLCLGLALGAAAWMSGSAISNHARGDGVVGDDRVLMFWGVAVMVVGAVVIIASVVVAVLALWSRRVPPADRAGQAQVVA